MNKKPNKTSPPKIPERTRQRQRNPNLSVIYDPMWEPHLCNFTCTAPELSREAGGRRGVGAEQGGPAPALLELIIVRVSAGREGR